MLKASFSRAFLTTALAWAGSFTIAQTTQVSGRIFDGPTGQAMPYVHVSFTGTNVGTTTDIEGQYTLASSGRVGRLRCSSLGFQTQVVEVRTGIEQVINIALEPQAFQLGAAEVRPDEDDEENPATPLIQRIIDAKDMNNPARIPALRYEQYSRLEVDLNDISVEQTQRWYWGPFGWVFDYMDSTEARPALPFILAEIEGRVTESSRPKRKQILYAYSQTTELGEIEEGSENHDDPNENAAEANAELQDINLYENRILVMDRGFTSPLHNRGPAHYRYYILDTLDYANTPCFRMAYVPRRRGELTFEGELWVDTLTLGLVHAEARVSDDANLNFVRGMRWEQTFKRVGEHWLLSDENSLMDVSVTEQSIGLYVRRVVHNEDWEIREEAWPDSLWSNGSEFVFGPDSIRGKGIDLERTRPIALVGREIGIVEMVDSLVSMKEWRFLQGLGFFLGTGYAKAGPLEVGSIWRCWAANPIEGERYRLDLRTSNRFSKYFMPSVYAAYGTLDREWKGGAKVLWIQQKRPRREWFASAQFDLEQFGLGGALMPGDVLTSGLRTMNGNRLAAVTRYDVLYAHEWGQGWRTTMSAEHRRIAPRGELDFEPFVTAEAKVEVRWARGERFLSGEFDRVSIGNRAPIFTAVAVAGLPNIGGSSYRYERYSLAVEHTLQLGWWGAVNWFGEGGIYTGSAPYLLMQVVPATGTVLFDVQAFNLLDYYEFVADRWVTGGAEWHAEGLVLNRLKLLRRIGLREVVGVRGIAGGWDVKHEALGALPEGTSGLSSPYLEVNAGIENIFRFLRLDAVWRTEPSGWDWRAVHWRVGFGVSF